MCLFDFSVVCYANGTTFQCRCEEQYHWPCHMCSTLDKCDDKIEGTCRCIIVIPPVGVYCQPLSGRHLDPLLNYF